MKLKFYMLVTMPILMYGSEYWTMTNRQKQQIKTVEISFLRSIAEYNSVDK